MKKATGIFMCSGLGLVGGLGFTEVVRNIMPSDLEFLQLNRDVHACAEELPVVADGEARVLPIPCQVLETNFETNKDPIQDNVIHLRGEVLDRTAERYVLPTEEEFLDANLPKIENRENFQDRAHKTAAALGTLIGMAVGYNIYQAFQLKEEIEASE